MKKFNYLSLAAIAAFGLASCSSDEPFNGSNDNQGSLGEQYMAVSIRTAGLSGTRADVFEEAATGSNEAAIDAKNLYFFFYDGDGNPFQLAASNVDGTVSTNMVQPREIKYLQTPGGDPSIEGVLVLGKAVGEGYVGTTPKKMLCVANPNAGNMPQYVNKPLQRVIDEATRADDGIPALTNFLMTSSTYVDGGEPVTAVNVEGKFKDTPEDAQKYPATIYLERLAAKVRAHGLGDYTPKAKGENDLPVATTYKVNNKEVELQVSLDAWRLTNIANKSNAFKSIANIEYFPNWNAPTLHRCYWAISNAGTLANPTFNIYYPKGEVVENPNPNYWSRTNYDSTKPLENIAYIYENTQFTKAPRYATDRFSNATGLVVKATVKMKNAEGVFEPVDLVRWAGAYYTSAELKNMIFNNYKATHENTTLTANDVDFVKDTNPNRWKAIIRNSAGADIDMSVNYNNIMWWQNGLTSYYLNIQHAVKPDATDATKSVPVYGIVRNHIYDYTFTDVIGLGVPGNEPEDPAVEKETFLAARLAVLNWHVISNNVVLE